MIYTKMRKATADLAHAEKMMDALRLLPAPDADKAVSINAIHALLATMTPNAGIQARP
ncbi:MAG: hypothetical protein BWZ07_02907 [Alphaproteobacteria bacterium ADurb.BinA280]|nr:MAG: hypothetical protein BWZ07_02907 [Alphaproteobacteria bacterium ADurb.BinA280]